MRHIISVLLQNEAGALSRAAALFSSRGYNIDSLCVAPTEDAEISRLTLVTRGSDEVIDQINQQLLKLVDVVNIADMTLDDHIERELLLIKVKVSEDAECSLPDIIQSSGARVLDDSPETFTLELTATNEEMETFITRVGECSEILAVVRSGAMAIARGHNILSSNIAD
jgi:acetolactate synthase-1/3 small subunit